MKLRTDGAHLAGWHRALDLGALDRKDGSDYSLTLATPAAEPGDVWYIREKGVVVGYALTCPKTDCHEGMHWWDHAYHCRPGARTCPEGRGCWTWSGSAEDGTLTASPSLHCVLELGGCGWHGWLRSGEMAA